MKKVLSILLMLALTLSLAACGGTPSQSGADSGSQNANSSSTANSQASSNSNANSNGNASSDSSSAAETTDLFTDRDLSQTADLTEAVSYTLSSGEDITITSAGVYVLTGTASGTTVVVDAGDDDKVQLVLDGVSITNDDFPCIYVKNADKVFVTTTDSQNVLKVTGTFRADGSTHTDAVIFSRDDLVFNGTGSLQISSTDNGISGKDDIKVTGGTLSIVAEDCGIEANDAICMADGAITISAKSDGLHAENDDDNTKGSVYIGSGTLDIQAGDDGIHATTVAQIDNGEITVTAAEGIEATQIQINGGTIHITATDDGVNAAKKSSAYTALFEMNGGALTVVMANGDTDAIDANGDLRITGGTLDLTCRSPFDYDGTAEYTGGTIIVNGVETNTIANQAFGPGGMRGGPGH